MEYEFGPQKLKALLVQPFSEEVSSLIDGGNKLHTMSTSKNKFSDEVIVKLDVLGASIKDRSGGHVGGAQIIAIECDRSRLWNVKLTEKIMNPNRFSADLSKRAILGLSTGARYSRLFLCTPGYEIRTQKNTITRGGATGIRAASPVGIREGIQVQWAGRGAKSNTKTNRAFEIAKNTLHSSKVRRSRGTHKLSNMMYSKGNVRSCQCQIL